MDGVTKGGVSVVMISLMVSEKIGEDVRVLNSSREEKEGK